MIVHFGRELVRAEWNAATVCIGTFDGVHLGHQEVIRTAVERAEAEERPCVLVTFDRHPAHQLAPERKPPAIATLEQNLRMFDRLGVGVCVVLPFDAELSSMSADAFLREILVETLHARALVVGHDFAMGKGRVGTASWLSERIPTETVPPFEIEGRRVSSSEIRRDIQQGDLDVASRLLGRPFSVRGVVVAGQKLGRQLGFPTINLARASEQVLPPDGIYAGYCETPYGNYKAAISHGARPTIEGAARSLEAFLLEYPGNPLYGKSVELSFVQTVRNIEQFSSLEELRLRMAKDVEAVAVLPRPETQT